MLSIHLATLISAPRVSGDEPDYAITRYKGGRCSPRERG